MKNTIFREYDIRGIVGKEFTIEETSIIAKSIITYFKNQSPNIKNVIIARDGRNHSPIIRNKIIDAIIKMGINVLDIGICPTPTFYFTLFNSSVTSGLMITASHNPKEYNGIKICLNTKSVWGKEIQKIKNISIIKNFYHNQSNYVGNIEYRNMIPIYIDWLTKHFKHLKGYDINAVIDIGNATGGTVIPSLIEKMEWKNIKVLHEKIDGNFPHHEADPTNIDNMQDVIKEFKNDHSLTFGLGLDGDCDRMSPITKTGYLVPGDQLLAIFAKKVLADFPKSTIVFDIKASSSLIELLRKWGATDHMCPSGHSLVKEALISTKAKLAGELSCHFFFNDRYFGYDDGIYSILRLFEILKETNKTLDELIAIFPKKEHSPEIRIKCNESEKTKIVNHVKNIFATKKLTNNITIDGLRAETNYGWGLVRESNTQPMLSLRFESNDKKGLNQIKNDFYKALKPFFNEKDLKKNIELE